ncbi:hypothetical protein ACFLWI_07830 [Chloroflexota bacterium]
MVEEKLNIFYPSDPLICFEGNSTIGAFKRGVSPSLKYSPSPFKEKGIKGVR